MQKVEGTDGYGEWGDINRAMVERENADLGSRAANRNKRPEKPRQVALIML